MSAKDDTQKQAVTTKRPKKAYRPPKLEVLGSLRQATRGSAGTVSDGGAGLQAE